MAKSPISFGIALLGALLLLGLLFVGCSKRDEEIPGSEDSTNFSVSSASREFNEQKFQNTLADERRADRDYGTEQASSSSQEKSVRTREFDARNVTNDYREQRREDRAAIVTEGSSSDEAFSYDAFIARMTDLRAQQKSGDSERTTSSSFRTGSAFATGSSFSRGSNSSSLTFSGSAGSTTGTSSLGGSSSSAVAECGDGKDNDGDGTVDADDPQCHSDGKADFLPSYDYRRKSESQNQATTSGASSSRVSGATGTHIAGDCGDRSVIPAFGNGAFTGNEGATFPHLVNGDCPVVGAILPVWAPNNDTVFGSLDF